MDFLIPTGLVVWGLAVVAFLLASINRAARDRKRRWLEAANDARLTDVAASSVVYAFGSELRGRKDQVNVRLTTYTRDKKPGTRIVVGGLRHWPDDLAFRAESFGTSLEKVVGTREIELGDPVFDDAVFLQGAAPLAFALFDAETRRGVLRMVQGAFEAPGSSHAVTHDARVTLSAGELQVELSEGRWGQAGGGVVELLPRIVAIAQRLVRPDDLAARLAENFRCERVVEVRLGCLRVMLQKYPDHPRTRDALLAALADPHQEIRLRSAIALGEAGHQTLLDLVTDPMTEDGRLGRAVDALGDVLSPAQAMAVLRPALRERRLATARACVRRLGRGADRSTVETLRRVLALEQDELAIDAAKALGVAGDASAEPTLLAALREGSPELTAAAAAALGAVGTTAAVMPLREIAGDRDYGGDARRAARQAVAAIQSRLTGAAPGQLSLTGAETGQLSLADEERGRVSLAGRETPAGAAGSD